MPRKNKAEPIQHYACYACGVLFPAKRDDAQYCGPTCRQRISRDNRKRLGTTSTKTDKYANFVKCSLCGTTWHKKKDGKCLTCAVQLAKGKK